MAPTRPKSKKSKKRYSSSAKPDTINLPVADTRVYLTQASAALQQGDAESAAKLAKKALNIAKGVGEGELACLTLLGEIHVELGAFEEARSYFLRAARLDPEGQGNDPKTSYVPSKNTEDEVMTGGGPETFLWLAQLSPDGGKDSVAWFEKGAVALRRQIGILVGLPTPARTPKMEEMLEEKRKKLSETLCSVTEVYMTDLSWESDAEERCEALVTEATMISSDSAEAWQTLANVRISQQRIDEAKTALKRSMETWQREDGTEIESDKIPDFASRVSLARLLIEVEMFEQAMEVLARMALEDDQSVEVAYLGGWGRYLWGAKAKEDGAQDDEWQESWRESRRWLTRCLKLFQTLEYEDEQLGQHTQEIIEEITKALGPVKEGEEDEVDEDEEWEDASEDDMVVD